MKDEGFYIFIGACIGSVFTFLFVLLMTGGNAAGYYTLEDRTEFVCRQDKVLVVRDQTGWREPTSFEAVVLCK